MDDSSADKFAKEVNPNVKYCSEEFYAILSKKYLEFVITYPFITIKSIRKTVSNSFILFVALNFLSVLILRLENHFPKEAIFKSIFFFLCQLLLPVLTEISTEYIMPALAIFIFIPTYLASDIPTQKIFNKLWNSYYQFTKTLKNKKRQLYITANKQC